MAKRKKGNGPFTLFPLFLIGLVMLGFSIHKYSADAEIRANGETIEATISGIYRQAKSSDNDEIRYEIWLEWTYGGETYEGKFYQKTKSVSWETGDAYEIIVDKDHPDQWCKTENSWGTLCAINGVLTAIFGMMWLYFLVDWIRWKRNIRMEEISEDRIDF